MNQAKDPMEKTGNPFYCFGTSGACANNTTTATANRIYVRIMHYLFIQVPRMPAAAAARGKEIKNKRDCLFFCTCRTRARVCVDGVSLSLSNVASRCGGGDGGGVIITGCCFLLFLFSYSFVRSCTVQGVAAAFFFILNFFVVVRCGLAATVLRPTIVC